MFWRRFSTALSSVLICSSIMIGVVMTGRADAAQTATVGQGNALKISPVRMDLKMEPGTQQKVEITVQNLTSLDAELRLIINDFVASGDESGRPNIILDENEFAPDHSLKRLVQPPDTFLLHAGEERNIPITIVAPKDIPGGGYYGAVRVAPADIGGDRNVSLAASVGTLVLVKMSGDVDEELLIESFDVRRQEGGPSSFFTSPKDLNAVVRFKNVGNVQAEPFGNIVLQRFGKTVETYQLNEGTVRSSVLPDSIRRFDTSLTKLSPFGKYTLIANLGYGETGQLLTAQTTFYVIPVFMILIAIAAILLILFLIFVLPRMIRAYNRRVIRRASRRRRY